MRRFVEYRPQDELVDVQLTSGAMHVSVDLDPVDAARLSLDLWGAVPDRVRASLEEADDGD